MNRKSYPLGLMSVNQYPWSLSLICDLFNLWMDSHVYRNGYRLFSLLLLLLLWYYLLGWWWMFCSLDSLLISNESFRFHALRLLMLPSSFFTECLARFLFAAFAFLPGSYCLFGRWVPIIFWCSKIRPPRFLVFHSSGAVWSCWPYC